MTTLSRARLVALPSLLLLGAAALAVVPLPRRRRRAGHHGGTAARWPSRRKPPDVRFQTFNASLNRATAGQLVTDLSTPDDAQAAAVAEIVQRTRPDVLLLNEFDYVAGGRAVRLFQDNYLEAATTAPSRSATATPTPRRPTPACPAGSTSTTTAPSAAATTPTASATSRASTAWSCSAASRSTPQKIRTFQKFRWADMPGNLIPTDFYSPQEQAALRLSSKSHWDLPIEIGRETVHFLVSHPTPPTFDGPEDRNGTRNHDEIRFWADYVSGARYMYDDRGRRGGLARKASFVIAGDQNADPLDGDSVAAAIDQLLDSPRITDPLPTSAGGPDAAARQGGANLDPPRRPALRHRRLQRQPGAGQPARRLRPALARPAGPRTPASSGRSRPTRSSAWSATSRSRRPTTARSGSTCAYPPR